VGPATGGAGEVNFTANTVLRVANTGGSALSVAGNIIGGNISTGGSFSLSGNLSAQTVAATGNITGGNVLTGGIMSATGTITGGNVLTGGIMSATGNITGGNIIAIGDVYTAFSDERLKANIQPITNPLDKVMAIRGVTFQPNEVAATWGFTDTKVQLGVLAQEVEKIFPEIIHPAPFDIMPQPNGSYQSRSGENFKTIQYERLVPLLIEAVKELKVKIDKLEIKD
jgi:hypothetical protein